MITSRFVFVSLFLITFTEPSSIYDVFDLSLMVFGPWKTYAPSDNRGGLAEIVIIFADCEHVYYQERARSNAAENKVRVVDSLAVSWRRCFVQILSLSARLFLFRKSDSFDSPRRDSLLFSDKQGLVITSFPTASALADYFKAQVVINQRRVYSTQQAGEEYIPFGQLSSNAFLDVF
jgi:hypothetical protein